MAITATPYLITVTHLAQAQQDLYGDTLNFALFTSDYVPNYFGDFTFGGVAGFETSGAGYDTGGKSLANRSQSFNNTTFAFLLTADALVWPALTATFRYAVLYNLTKNETLIGCIDFGENLVYNQSDFTLDLTDGFISLGRA